MSAQGENLKSIIDDLIEIRNFVATLPNRPPKDHEGVQALIGELDDITDRLEALLPEQ